MATAADVFPHIDASKQSEITGEQAQFFRENGLLVIRNLLRCEELLRMQAQTLPLIERAAKDDRNDPWHGDFSYRTHEQTGQRVPSRVEYVIDKTEAGKALLGHPFILRSVEKLQGRDFIPTWDSMVFKFPGMGASIPWHRDAGTDCCGEKPIFNVDFYLDNSDATNCLWGIPGSNRWPVEKIQAELRRLSAGGFSTEGAVPLEMNAGDVIFHNILALHGSAAARSKLRRVVYYEFRPIRTELEKGPHSPAYIPIKQHVLLKCLEHRAAAPYAQGERPYLYRPSPEFSPPSLTHSGPLATYRYPHKDYARKA